MIDSCLVSSEEYFSYIQNEVKLTNYKSSRKMAALEWTNRWTFDCNRK